MAFVAEQVLPSVVWIGNGWGGLGPRQGPGSMGSLGCSSGQTWAEERGVHTATHSPHSPHGQSRAGLSERAVWDRWLQSMLFLVVISMRKGICRHNPSSFVGGGPIQQGCRHVSPVLSVVETKGLCSLSALGMATPPPRPDSKNSRTTPATTSTTSICQLLGATDAQTAHDATFSTAPAHQPLGPANEETTPARAPAAAADRKQHPDATCEGKNG